MDPAGTDDGLNSAPQVIVREDDMLAFTPPGK